MIATSSTDWLAISVPLGVPLLAGVVAWFANGIRADRVRRRKLYADAFSALVSYKEFPFMIRRRRAPGPGQENLGNEERLRISTALHEVQEAISNYQAQIKTENGTVSETYEALVTKTRVIAGSQMREAWKQPPLNNDAGMNTAVDYSALKSMEDNFLGAALKDVQAAKWPPWR
jgi:hypothetical protein